MSNVLVICVCFKIYFLIDHHCKTPRTRQKLLKFLQSVMEGRGVHVACNDKLHWNFIESALKIGDMYEVLVTFIAT